MYSLFRVILLLFITGTGFAQVKDISGEVRSRDDNAPLPYVSIGIQHKTVGTVSRKNGFFKLILDEQVAPEDTVTFSHVGYKTAHYLVSELQTAGKPIFMEPQQAELQEVVITSKKVKLKPHIIGRASKGMGLMHANFYTSREADVDDRLSKEMGMKFKIKNNCYIRDLNFNITSNDFSSVKFRVNFYHIRNGIPADLMVQENIIFEVKGKYLGWFKVDLTPYNIYLKEADEEVAVTVQWLESVKADPKGKYFAISTAGTPLHTAYFREKAMDDWTMEGQQLSFYLHAMCD